VSDTPAGLAISAHEDLVNKCGDQAWAAALRWFLRMRAVGMDGEGVADLYYQIFREALAEVTPEMLLAARQGEMPTSPRQPPHP
jgi:hypothetical protein